MDEVDAAQHNIEMFLTASLLKHQQRLNQVGDIEAETCNGCSYATKASWGRRCESWKECRDDLDKRETFSRGGKA
jgi:hypothetical protein